MNTYVNVGSSQDYKLTRALLVYGESSYNGYPYRHPFVTLHDVIHDEGEARLGAAQLLTPDLLRSLILELSQPLPAEVSITVTNSGEGTAGVRKTLHNTKRNRVSYESEHDRDRQLGLPECDHGW